MTWDLWCDSCNCLWVDELPEFADPDGEGVCCPQCGGSVVGGVRSLA